MLLNTLKIVESKRADPTAYLEGMGFTVRKEGRHLSVRSGNDERYRMTQKPDGHWVTCDQPATASATTSPWSATWNRLSAFWRP